MAQIPLGNFDQVNVSAQPNRIGVDTSPMNNAGQGAAAIGEALGNASHVLAQNAIADKEKAGALVRMKAANNLSTYESQVVAARSDFEVGLKTRQNNYETAGTDWQKVLGSIPPPTLPPGAAPELAEHFKGGVQKIQDDANLGIHVATGAAQRDDLLGQAVLFDKDVIKRYALNGDTNRALEAFSVNEQNYRLAGVPEHEIQTIHAKNMDELYSSDVATRIESGGDNRAALVSLHNDLTAKDGRYIGLMEPIKRLAYAQRVQGRIDQIDAEAQSAADERDKLGKAAVEDIWKTAATPIMPSDQQIAGWSAAIKGTKYETDGIKALTGLQQGRQLRTMTPAQQDFELGKLQAQVEQGGSAADWEHLKQMRSMVDSDRKLRQDDPQQWLTGVTGKAPAQIDLNAMLSGNMGAVASAIQDRANRIGPLVSNPYQTDYKLLTAPEAQALSNVVSTLPPGKMVETFGMLRVASGSQDNYEAIMRQIGADDPVKAQAGVIATYHGGQRIAETLLMGNALLGKKDEGGTKYYSPPDKDMRAEFAFFVGNAFQGRADIEQKYQAVRAYYAGMASKFGETKSGDTLNKTLMDESIKSIVGDIAEINGTHTMAPFGMTADNFEAAAPSKMKVALRAAGLSPDTHAGLLATPRPGTYMLVNGIVPIYNPKVHTKDGRQVPVIVDFGDRTPAIKPSAPKGH